MYQVREALDNGQDVNQQSPGLFSSILCFFLISVVLVLFRQGVFIFFSFVLFPFSFYHISFKEEFLG